MTVAIVDDVRHLFERIRKARPDFNPVAWQLSFTPMPDGSIRARLGEGGDDRFVDIPPEDLAETHRDSLAYPARVTALLRQLEAAARER